MVGIDLVLPEQKVDAFDVAFDAPVLERHHCLEVELGRGNVDSHLGEGMPCLLEQFRRVQERLRGNAADVEAGAPIRGAFLDNSSSQAKLCGTDGAYIAAWAGADDDVVVGHQFTPHTRSSWPGLSRPSTS